MTPKRKGAGRPTKYKAEMARKLPDMFANGESVVEVCVELGISKNAFYEWVKKHKAFAAAYELGKSRSEAWWTRLGRAAAAGGVEGFQGTPWVFNMKNRFGWKDNPSDPPTVRTPEINIYASPPRRKKSE